MLRLRLNTGSLFEHSRLPSCPSPVALREPRAWFIWRGAHGWVGRGRLDPVTYVSVLTGAKEGTDFFFFFLLLFLKS